MDCLPLFKWFQPILNPEFSLIFGQIRIRFQIQEENTCLSDWSKNIRDSEFGIG